jgi:hypothetical protein
MTAVYVDPAILWGRILERIEQTASGCWLFTGCTNSRGYGLVFSGRKGKNILAHRLAVIVRDGSIPDGMTVDHQCHDSQTCRLDAGCPHRRCVNPAHLRVMTSADNVRRRWERQQPKPVDSQAAADFCRVMAEFFGGAAI